MNILPVDLRDGGLKEAFHRFPFDLHRGDPCWIPPREPKNQWDPRGPFLSRLEARLFLAENGGKILARCAALVNRHLPDYPGLIGFFESVEDPEPAVKVISAAEAWMRRHRKKTLLGPMNGSTWHTYRFITGGSLLPPFLLEPWNPPYYPRHWEKAGWKPVKRYFSTIVPKCEWVRDPLNARWKSYIETGCGFRTVNTRRWREEIRLLFHLSRRIFADNWAYTEIFEEEFLDMYEGVGFILRPQNLLFALDPQGREMGFLFTLPDEARRVRAMGGSSDLAAKLRFLSTPRETERLVFKTFAVLPGMRKMNVGSALINEAERLFAGEEWREGIHALMSGDNFSRSYSRGRGCNFREYALFGRETA
jgi:GNAT superfamily N-acetyltransferase